MSRIKENNILFVVKNKYKKYATTFTLLKLILSVNVVNIISSLTRKKVYFAVRSVNGQLPVFDKSLSVRSRRAIGHIPYTKPIVGTKESIANLTYDIVNMFGIKVIKNKMLLDVNKDTPIKPIDNARYTIIKCDDKNNSDFIIRYDTEDISNKKEVIEKLMELSVEIDDFVFCYDNKSLYLVPLVNIMNHIMYYVPSLEARPKFQREANLHNIRIYRTRKRIGVFYLDKVLDRVKEIDEKYSDRIRSILRRF